jgi:hypothetical protein
MEKQIRNRSKNKNKKKTAREILEKNTTKIIGFGVLFAIWAAVFLIITVVFIVSELTDIVLVKESTDMIISIIISFSSFITTSMFSFAIFYHNQLIRGLTLETQKRTDDQLVRDEQLRVLQFCSANLSVVDFVDFMLISREHDTYVKKHAEARDFSSYLREDDIDINDVTEHIENYAFRTIRLPVHVLEGKAISKIGFTRFKFVREEGVHYFVPATESNTALIIFNETDKRCEAVVNIILKKTSGFYAPKSVLPCQKIKINLIMTSLLGVAVGGTTELYFTNPKKLEGDGSNKYTINSSQFEINGLPELVIKKDELLG